MAARKKVGANRWTQAEVDRLHELVRTEGTIAAGVRVFAAETNRKPASVMAKWYKLKDAEKVANGHAPVVSAQASRLPTGELSSLSTDALVALYGAAKDEINRRIEALQEAASDA